MTTDTSTGHRLRRGLAAWPFAVAGLVSAGVLFASAELVAAFFATASSPMVAMGAVFIDITPPWLKDLAIATFGTNDKLALFVSIGIVSAIAAALIGILARRRFALAAGIIALLGVAIGASVLSRPATGPLDLLPTVVGTLAGIGTLRLLTDRARAAVGDTSASADEPLRPGEYVVHRTPSSPMPGARTGARKSSRRGFLAAAGLAAVAAGAMAAGGRALSGVRNAAQATREALRLPAPKTRAEPLPAGVSADVEGMPPFVTPNADFYRIDTALAVPRIEPSEWSLRVHGMVEEEFTITFDELLQTELQETWVTLTCVSNAVGGDLVGNAKWLGYPLRSILERARPQAGADMVLSTSIDGFSASTPLEVLTDDRDALLAVGMNGEPLPLEHGFPVRMVVPGLYGYVSATKWVVDLEVTRFADKAAYWTTRGWDERGPIKIASRVDVPRAFAKVPAGRAAFGGTAWAQQRGIDKVQIRIDDGEWRDAELAAEASVDTWRQWSYVWDDATPGPHSVSVRAVDGTGEVQTEERADPIPNGASGWQRIQFTVE
ncbi:MAG: molybdopterin-dependent oxidoreductase [Arthrobacter sp.]|uniref:molybdopterin-dependent oxidoreductase n=1 Tax=Arthrobacter sp. TaxID=1667 RepID=UPI0034745205